MTELPLTITRRRTGNSTKHSSDVGETSSDWNDNKPTSAFSSFSSLSTALWASAQNTLSKASSPFFGYTEDSDAISSSNSLSQTPLAAEIFGVMAARDRTSEFRTAAKSYQMKIGGGYIPLEPKNRLVQRSVQFAQFSKRIGRDLSLTCAKMEKLTELAKRRSLFDDRMVEVEELSRVIRQDITDLNKQIAALQEFSKRSGDAKKKDQSQNHSQLVVVILQSKLAGVSKNFQDVLELRTENLKQQKSRREKFSQSYPVPSTLPSSASAGNLGSVLLQDDMKASSSIAVDMKQLEEHRLQEQVSLINEQDSYLQARSATMETIESSISELGQIFRQLASLVSEQGEMITRIDSNVEETSLNVEAAHTELVKYLHYVSQNRWLMIKVFGILIFFFIIFIIFLT